MKPIHKIWIYSSCILLLGVFLITYGSSGNPTWNPNPNTQVQAPPILIQGNMVMRDNPNTANDRPYLQVRSFNPQTPTTSEFSGSPYHTRSIINSANRLIDMVHASCAGPPGQKHLGYDKPEVWADKWVKIPGKPKYQYQYPDTMPPTADITGTNGTQFIQLILPYEILDDSVFDKTNSIDYLNPDALTIEDDKGNHVPCTVLVNGKDAWGNGPNIYTKDPQWPQLKGVNINPGANKSSIVFIAQPKTGVINDVPDMTPFKLWSMSNEMRIHLKMVKDKSGKSLMVNGKWMVLKEGGTPNDLKIKSIHAIDLLMDKTAQPVIDPMGSHEVVRRKSGFMVSFNKPVIPETLAQSIYYGHPQFNGNTGPISEMITNPSLCANGGTNTDPIIPNLALVVKMIDPSGATYSHQAAAPFRCRPVTQNNLFDFIIDPVIDLSSSSYLGSPPFNDPNVTEIHRVRVSLEAYPHDSSKLLKGVWNRNMGPCGYFGGQLKSLSSVTYTVESSGRTVNAPVCPNAIYYGMRKHGLGVIDLDGNGFTTNDPAFSRPMLVTSFRYLTPGGNAAKGIGNNYAYGAKAAGPGKSIGLGSATIMPGVNEGSSGMDELVRDSRGNAKLFPPSRGNPLFVSDIEVGDFLDTIFYDKHNNFAQKLFHHSLLNATPINTNSISGPPTPNPPPLTLPIGMCSPFVGQSPLQHLDKPTYVIMGKEVFTRQLPWSILPLDTGFIHLQYAAMTSPPSSSDMPFPPNPFPPLDQDFVNTGPLAESSTTGSGFMYSSRQQIGNFLFVADKANNAVVVLNSNTMEVIHTIHGFSQPDGMAITPDLKTLYVANSGISSVDVVDADPTSAGFLMRTNTISVGKKPKGICVQPDMEDVFVCNFKDNSISIIDHASKSVRKTLKAYLNHPWDMVTGPRQTTFGFGTGVYNGYISNHGAHNVLVFESGPDGFGGIGYDDIIGPALVGSQFLPIESPRGLCWDPHYQNPNQLSGGCYVAHKSGTYGMVSHIEFTTQKAPYGPIMLPAPFTPAPNFRARVYEVTGQWGGMTDPLSGKEAVDVALADYNLSLWENSNLSANPYCINFGDLGQNPHSYLPCNNKHPMRIVAGNPMPVYLPDRLYISFKESACVDIVNPMTGQKVKTINNLPAPAWVLKSYFK